MTKTIYQTDGQTDSEKKRPHMLITSGLTKHLSCTIPESVKSPLVTLYTPDNIKYILKLLSGL